MKDEIVDASLFVTSLVKGEEFHSEAIRHIEDMIAGERLLHTSTLVPVEVCEAIFRSTGSAVRAYMAERTLDDWIREGKIKLYNLDKQRMDAASEIVVRRKLKGSNAIVSQLSEELNIPLITFDRKL